MGCKVKRGKNKLNLKIIKKNKQKVQRGWAGARTQQWARGRNPFPGLKKTHIWEELRPTSHYRALSKQDLITVAPAS